ncbi:hypothetical protein HHS34_005540 [Acidithiobacillus montserratensis]|uniref:Uncharacterized protein n=1 Tax=Acidithiobacillus montserratensis TaxID=2729135 RepID=A0ACD5HL38_9PROT|nr:hypothetical protein [Acidithiobacillus montserratensis]MBU2747859.1 restriction endonuclease [Acidithiobacillus montserratensis]
MTKLILTIGHLCAEAHAFSVLESTYAEPALFGVTDGKAVGTYLEHKFRIYLQERYDFEQGNSANGIDFPSLGVDMKVTSIRQPQSSCPFKSARQKVYGLGYGLIVFVYDKEDDHATRAATLRMTNTVFVEAHRTADFQMTRGLRQIVENEGNDEDLMAFMAERNLPVDEIELKNLAEEVLRNKPEQGYLTISNALQWRLQYGRVIEKAGTESGLRSIYKSAPFNMLGV